MKAINPITLVWVILSLLVAKAVDISPTDTDLPSFNYTDPSTVPRGVIYRGKCLNGKRQTPINIVPSNYPSSLASFGFIPIQEFRADHFFLNNNKWGPVYLDLSPLGCFTRIFPGYGLTSTPYRLSNIHFHWRQRFKGVLAPHGPEFHQINGHTHSMEMHMVHFRADFKTIDEAMSSGQSDAMAVFAVLLQVEENARPNPYLAPIIAHLPKIHGTHNYYVKVTTPIDFTNIILREQGDTIYAYQGSLTTVDCLEIIHWFIKKDPIIISKSDEAAFQNTQIGASGFFTNFRGTQPLYGRPVYTILAPN